MSDQFTTTSLARTIESLKMPVSFLLERFFGFGIENYNTEEIELHRALDGRIRRLMSVVHKDASSPVIEGGSWVIEKVNAACLKDLRKFKPDMALRRQMGERVGGNLSPQQRRDIIIRYQLRDQLEGLARRKEYWAANVLRTGKLPLTVKMPDGEERDMEIDFGRDASLSGSLANGSRWGDSGVDPFQNMEDWALYALKNSGSKINNIVMDHEAYTKFKNTPQFEKRLDLRRVKSGLIRLDLLPEHVQYVGNDGVRDYWVYSNWYLPDGETGTNESAFLPEGTVIGVGNGFEGTQYNAAIMDEEAGMQAMPYFSNSWIERNPSIRMLQLQANTLIAPNRINSSFCFNVLGNAL